MNLTFHIWEVCFHSEKYNVLIFFWASKLEPNASPWGAEAENVSPLSRNMRPLIKIFSYSNQCFFCIFFVFTSNRICWKHHNSHLCQYVSYISWNLRLNLREIINCNFTFLQANYTDILNKHTYHQYIKYYYA